EDEMDEIANRFALFFWARMQLKHPRDQAGGVPSGGPSQGSACLLLMETIMFSLSRQFGPQRCLQRAAFTLTEIVIALAVLGTMASGVYLGFNSVNTYAVSSRLYSES